MRRRDRRPEEEARPEPPMNDTSAPQLVAKLWSFCHVLRDDGLSYLDYTEQLTYLLFLKMADERERLGQAGPEIPERYSWKRLAAGDMDGEKLEAHYRDTLAALARSGGMLGLIFAKAQNRIQDPAKLRRLIVELIGKQDWASLSADVKGDAYEGLLAKNAEDVKGGAGQYFTPRPLIAAIVDCVRPKTGETICDPACGTGGFLLKAHEYLVREHGTRMDKDQKTELRLRTLRGVELVESVSRLCAMNLILHGIGPTNGNGEPPIRTDDALREEPKDHFDVVLTNPPFGKKSSVTIVNEGWISVWPPCVKASPQTTTLAPSRCPSASAAVWSRTGSRVSSMPRTRTPSAPSRRATSRSTSEPSVRPSRVESASRPKNGATATTICFESGAARERVRHAVQAVPSRTSSNIAATAARDRRRAGCRAGAEPKSGASPSRVAVPSSDADEAPPPSASRNAR
jgi:hypothetical protein